YSLKWYQQQTNQIKITLNQNQSDVSVSFFEAPVPVRVHGENGEILNLVLNNNSNGEEFTEAVTFKVTKVEIDPDSHLISKNNSVTLGIDDEVLASQFSVFPNPVTNELTVKNPNQIHIEKITIFNSLGQLERQLKNVNTINVSTLMNGLHFLRIQTEQGVFHKSFLKQ
ncbi:MAG TPA: peptidase M1, partial [Flavobacteriaceae bacterium]|nr:peptidase M1 [Flavobacteriaceae bacterium]